MRVNYIIKICGYTRGWQDYKEKQRSHLHKIQDCDYLWAKGEQELGEGHVGIQRHLSSTSE